MSLSSLRLFAVSLVIMLLAGGCSKDGKDECIGRMAYTFYRPVMGTLTDIRKEMKWTAPQKIERPGKIYLYHQYLFLSEQYKGVHVFDNTNPQQPKQIGFIRIDGNADLAIRNDVLYADSYGDLAIIPIQNLQGAKAVAFKEDVFYKSYSYSTGMPTTNPDSVQVVVSYEQVDTLIDCNTYNTWMVCGDFADASGRIAFSSMANATKAGGGNGTGGSMARFTLVDKYLYTVTHSELLTFDLDNALNPELISQQQPGWNLETIFPFKNNLFIGSFTGMFIYNLSNPTAPLAQGQFSHARVCDPVIADDRYAYVTLRSGNQQCNGFTNQLDVVDITDVAQPKLLKSYPLTNPHGLSKDGDILFICDGRDGLKMFDASNAGNIKLRQTVGNIGDAYDVIAGAGLAVVVSNKGIYQYSYAKGRPLKYLSKVYSVD